MCDAYAMFYALNSSFLPPRRKAQLHAPASPSAGLRGRMRPLDDTICILNHAGTNSPQQRCKNRGGERSTDGGLGHLCSCWPSPHPYTTPCLYCLCSTTNVALDVCAGLLEHGRRGLSGERPPGEIF